MNHSVLTFIKIVFPPGILLFTVSIAFAQLSDKESEFVNKKISDSYLQEGHSAKHDGDFEEAIALYEKALDLDPGSSAAKSSRETALNLLHVDKWASTNLPDECRYTNQKINYDVASNCAKEYFSVYGEPIHPEIINALGGHLLDSGDQVVSINLL